MADEPPAGKQPEAAAPRPVERSQEKLQIYFLKPKIRDIHHLFELTKMIQGVFQVQVRADEFSRTLVVQAPPSLLPEIEKLVTTLQKEEGISVSMSSLRQVALDIKVVLASAADGPATTSTLDSKVVDKLRSLFGYKSFVLLGTQYTQIKIGEQAQTETHFKDPRSEREFPFQISFSIEPDQDDLRIKAGIKAVGQQANISTAFLAKPDQTIILGNATLKTGEALIYLLTPRTDR